MLRPLASRRPLLAGLAGLTALAGLAALAAAAGCVGKTPSGGDPPDAPGGGSGKDAGPGTDALVDALVPFVCRDKLTTGIDNGHHRPGENCQQTCHNHGFFMSGTLYAAAGSATPTTVSGASITFIDADGVTGDMRTAANGNFWWSLPVAFPVTIIASSCPDVKKMNATVTAAGAGCNQSGCHDSSSSVSGNRIHLP